MRTVVIQRDFNSWRDAARGLLRDGVMPEEVLWSDDDQQGGLFFDEEVKPPQGNKVKVSPVFLDLAQTAAAHNDPRRWGLLYRILWRTTLGGETRLLANPADPDLRLVQNWCKVVRREIHKMHAFVRFREVGEDEASGREQFVAWFEPEFRTVRLGAPFFVKRFAAMDWAILTPDECAHWDGHELRFSPGVEKSAAPDEDALDELWRSYYKSIFNPARLKVNAMQSEMPKKYWKNLPEARLIEDLIANSGKKVREMMETKERPAKPAPDNAYLARLREMNREE